MTGRRPWGRRRRRVRVVAIALLAILGVVGAPTAASAHPLGNFSVNHAAMVRVQPHEVDVDLVVDLAELPSVPALRSLDADRDGTASAAERAAYGSARCAAYGNALDLELDRHRLALATRTTAVFVVPGMSGLRTVRVECRLRSPRIATVGSHVAFRDDTDGGHIGWREITAIGEGVTIAGSDVPALSPTAALTRYPQNRLAHPEVVHGAHLRVVALSAGGSPAGEPPLPGRSLLGGRADFVARSVAGHTSVAVVLLVAVLLGAAHAAAPGHGKTVMAAYLVGQGGRLRHAIVIGLSVTATHTAGVLVLAGLVTLSVLSAPERLYPWLGVVNGLLLVGVGTALLRSARRRASHSHGYDHEHDHGHDHGHDGHGHEHAGHDHGHGHHHPHSVGWRSLLTLGFVGGMVPSPSAVLMLFGASGVGRPLLGVLLVLAYGAGMAAALTVTGVALAYGHRRLLDRLAGRVTTVHRTLPRLAAALPVLTAFVIVVIGAVLSGRGLAQLIA